MLKWVELTFLIPRSLHNIRIERLWRDVRKDSLEGFRRTFLYLAYEDLLDMDEPIDRISLFLVYEKRIQTSLDQTAKGWNNHSLRTEGNQTPIALWELSRTEAIRKGYWSGDPGDLPAVAADPLYGCDGQAPLPPAEELDEASGTSQEGKDMSLEEEREQGFRINGDAELDGAREIMGNDFDYERDDGRWGMDVYLKVRETLTQAFEEFQSNTGTHVDSEE